MISVKKAIVFDMDGTLTRRYLDFDAIRQSSEKRDRIGEGLADAFDMGAI